MEGIKQVNAVAFFIKDEEGKLLEAGTIGFKKLHSAIQIEVKVLKQEAARDMFETMPPGGIAIVDKMTDGRIELISGEMDDTIPYSSITTAIDVLREKFDVPIIDVHASKFIAVKPNPKQS